jgi:diguanylate cyclase (GGDEF)-like protein/PAS domain S-box-containing protein
VSISTQKLSLRSQIGLAAGLVLAFTVLLQAVLLFSSARDELKRSLSQQLNVLVRQVGNELDDKMLMRVTMLEAMAAKFPHSALNDITATERFFESSPNLTHLIDDFYLFSDKGILLVDWPVAAGRRGLDMTDRDYIQRAMAQDKATISKPILGRSTKQPMVVISVPIRDKAGKLLGILGGVVNLKKTLLLKPLYDTKVGQSGYFYLVGPSRLTIMHPDPDRLLKPITQPGQNPELDRALSAGFEGTEEGVNSRGLKGLFSFTQLAHTGWVLAAVLPSDEAFVAVNDLRWRSMLFTTLLLIMAIAAVQLWLKRFTHPLEKLTDFLKTAQTLETPPPLVHSCLETERLSKAFAQFVSEQQSAQQKLAIATEKATAAAADLRVAATAFESQEGIFITDADMIILRVNKAFVDITGYSAAEAIGQTPSLLKSDRHDAKFYRDLYDCVLNQGAWQGEIWNRRKNGGIYPEWLTITAVKDEQGVLTHYVATLIDISERKAAEEQIQQLAFYDPLTRLPNRRLLLDRLHQALASCARNDRTGALLFIDMDNFKMLNDTLGHDKGDQLLQQVAQRLITCVRQGDSIARLGSDEFVIVLEDLDKNSTDAASQALLVGEKILAALNLPFTLTENIYHSTSSIGITLFSEQLRTADELMQHADLAVHEAKKAGRNTLRFFDPQMQAAISSRALLEKDFREGLLQQQFLLLYQPQVDSSGFITGAEALVRWLHPQRGMVSPATFIPLTEETGLILPLGLWVLETACQQLTHWSRQPETAHLTIAVNVSAVQFRHSSFVDQVQTVLERSGVDPTKLKLELTESMLVNDVEEIIEKMTSLKKLGICFSLDDFGTGYSSLTYLKRLPLDQLKIDQSFVRDLLTDPNDVAIARTVVALAQSMGLSVIAEGVETEEQRQCLQQQGCLAYQGYLFGRPMHLNELEQRLTSLQLNQTQLEK